MILFPRELEVDFGTLTPYFIIYGVVLEQSMTHLKAETGWCPLNEFALANCCQHGSILLHGPEQIVIVLAS